jgi:hypothetical protein
MTLNWLTQIHKSVMQLIQSWTINLLCNIYAYICCPGKRVSYAVLGVSFAGKGVIKPQTGRFKYSIACLYAFRT